MLGANVATMGAFVTLAPGAPVVAATCLAANTALSFAKGFTTTAAIGGADMRTSFSFRQKGLLTKSSAGSCGYYGIECLLRIRACR